MIEYTVIGNFEYKGKEYVLLLDNDKRYFFMGVNEKEEYEYITLQELIALVNKFTYNENVLLIEQRKKGKKIKIVPKVIIGTLLVTLTFSFGSLLNKFQSNKYKFDLSSPVTTSSYTATMSTTEEEEVKDKTQQAIEKILENAERDNDNLQTEESVVQGFNLKIVLDSEGLDEALGYKKETVTYDMIRQTIQNNNNIPQKFKDLYIILANNLERQYPKMDLRIWYENLKTMKILEVDEMQMKVKAISVNANACYRKDENTIYTVKGYEYIPGTWEYQVIMHEMGHPIRSGFIHKGDQEIRTQFENRSGEGTIVEESLNSLLTLRSYDKNERDVAYQLQSNMIETMVDSMDNYTYQDFVEHNITYFENKLNEQNGNNKAVEMLGLLNLQYKDYHDNDISVKQELFHPLYDYIATMYYTKNLSPNLTYEEAKAVRDRFIDKISFDVPEEYNLDIHHMEEFFDSYCAKIGITHDYAR